MTSERKNKKKRQREKEREPDERWLDEEKKGRGMGRTGKQGRAMGLKGNEEEKYSENVLEGQAEI